MQEPTNVLVEYFKGLDLAREINYYDAVGGEKANATLNKLPRECPYCHTRITPLVIGNNYYVERQQQLEVVCKCPDEDCEEMFIAYYSHYHNDDFLFQETSFGTEKTVKFSDYINSISPLFSEIFNQAYKASQHKLDHVSGPGYRKALEFLVKDYAKKLMPEKEKKIEKAKLAAVIRVYMSNDKIKSAAKRAAWIGNDETHYIRKWGERDTTDLVHLINMVVNYIQDDYELAEIERVMPDETDEAP